MTEFNYRDLNSRSYIWEEREDYGRWLDYLNLSWQLMNWSDVEIELKNSLEDKIRKNDGVMRLLETQPESQKAIEDLQHDNENIQIFIESEARNFRDLKFYLYQRCDIPEAREAVVKEVDHFIDENLGTDKMHLCRYQDLLFLASLGGQPAEGGLYRFRPWMGENFPPTVQQEDMTLLADMELIDSDVEPTYHGDNLTLYGSVILERLNEKFGLSTAELCYQAYTRKAAPELVR